jgi:hypothetical protein
LSAWQDDIKITGGRKVASHPKKCFLFKIKKKVFFSLILRWRVSEQCSFAYLKDKKMFLKSFKEILVITADGSSKL